MAFVQLKFAQTRLFPCTFSNILNKDRSWEWERADFFFKEWYSKRFVLTRRTLLDRLYQSKWWDSKLHQNYVSAGIFQIHYSYCFSTAVLNWQLLSGSSFQWLYKKVFFPKTSTDTPVLVTASLPKINTNRQKAGKRNERIPKKQQIGKKKEGWEMCCKAHASRSLLGIYAGGWIHCPLGADSSGSKYKTGPWSS